MDNKVILKTTNLFQYDFQYDQLHLLKQKYKIMNGLAKYEWTKYVLDNIFFFFDIEDARTIARTILR